MFWLFYILLLLFLWNPHVRFFLIGHHPVLQMAASVMSDLLWLLPAVALPIYIVLLIRQLFHRLIVRDSILIFFIILWIVSLVNFNFFFRVQFIYIIFFFSLWIVEVLQSKLIRIKTASFAIVLLCLVFHYNAQLVPLPIRHGKTNLSVMSFNFNTKMAFDDERTIQFIRRRVPDIVFLQEFTSREQKFILSKVSDLYPHFLAPARQFGKNDVLILSRKKIVYGDQVPLKTPFNKSFHSVNHAVIECGQQKIHLLNCHLNHAYKQLSAYLSAPDSTQLSALQASYRQQQEEAKLLFDYAQTLTGPVILAGDFNDTPNSLIYATFKKRYQNAFASAGWGLGATFGEWAVQKRLAPLLHGFAFDMLRIDHIFFSDDFIIKRATVEKISAFDHRPQIVTAILKED
jgi:endonuclease/exonuclease/phosphatase (EEP) superfamily protein YafD